MSYRQCHARSHARTHAGWQADGHREFCCGRSGAVAGLVTSIRQRVRVWDKGQKRSKSVRRPCSERVCAPDGRRFSRAWKFFARPSWRFRERTEKRSREWGATRDPRSKHGWHSQQTLNVTWEPDGQSEPSLPGPLSTGPWRESLSRQIRLCKKPSLKPFWLADVAILDHIRRWLSQLFSYFWGLNYKSAEGFHA